MINNELILFIMQILKKKNLLLLLLLFIKATVHTLFGFVYVCIKFSLTNSIKLKKINK